jgi:AcrR family transcriptional regulator
MNDGVSVEPPPPPNRRDSARTKASILRAAQAVFSSQGYAHGGVRDIAAAAGVNSNLVTRYFGSKRALFEAALKDALRIDGLLAAGREGFGRHVAQMLAQAPANVDPTAMMVLSTGDPEATALAVGLLDRTVIDTLAQWIGPPDADARAVQISILCTGFVTYHRLLPLAALASEQGATTVDWLAKSLQAIVDAGAVRPDSTP